MLKNKIHTILLIIAFVTAMLQPAVPFVQYYFSTQTQTTELESHCACECYEDQSPTNPPVADAYLKALLKRVCKDQKKQGPKLPVVSISVFVRTLYQNRVPVYECPTKNFEKISDFIIQPSTSSHIEELFRPPQLI